MEFLQDYIVLVIFGICYCVGFIVKTSLDFIPNKYIPLLMGILGVVLAMFNTLTQNTAFTLEILLQGLASGLAATGADQIIRNLKKGG